MSSFTPDVQLEMANDIDAHKACGGSTWPGLGKGRSEDTSVLGALFPLREAIALWDGGASTQVVGVQAEPSRAACCPPPQAHTASQAEVNTGHLSYSILSISHRKWFHCK